MYTTSSGLGSVQGTGKGGREHGLPPGARDSSRRTESENQHSWQHFGSSSWDGNRNSWTTGAWINPLKKISEVLDEEKVQELIFDGESHSMGLAREQCKT